MVLSNFLDNSGANIGSLECLILSRLLLFLLAILEIGNLLVNAHLLAHDALDINFLWLIIVLYQGIFDGFLKAFWIHRKILVWHELLNKWVASCRRLLRLHPSC